jgi:hypothetical protein
MPRNCLTDPWKVSTTEAVTVPHEEQKRDPLKLMIIVVYVRPTAAILQDKTDKEFRARALPCMATQHNAQTVQLVELAATEHRPRVP